MTFWGNRVELIDELQTSYFGFRHFLPKTCLPSIYRAMKRAQLQVRLNFVSTLQQRRILEKKLEPTAEEDRLQSVKRILWRERKVDDDLDTSEDTLAYRRIRRNSTTLEEIKASCPEKKCIEQQFDRLEKSFMDELRFLHQRLDRLVGDDTSRRPANSNVGPANTDNDQDAEETRS